MKIVIGMACCLATAGGTLAGESEHTADENRQRVQAVIERVEKECLDRTVYMIGRKKAERLAELVRRAKPKVVVECGTAIGYSGLWMARELQPIGGRLVTIEISPDRSREAQANFRQAGLEDLATFKVGDAKQVVKTLDGPIDFLFLDCGYSNYLPCLKELQDELSDNATVVADNVGIGERGMNDYLSEVRGKYKSRTEWFDLDLPWAKRDAMEITIISR
jgi:predicted O-methyltransferase YrrM